MAFDINFDGEPQLGRSEQVAPGQPVTVANVRFSDGESRNIGIDLEANVALGDLQSIGAAPGVTKPTYGGPATAIIEWGNAGNQHRAVVSIGSGKQVTVFGSYCRVTGFNECIFNQTKVYQLPIEVRATISFSASAAGKTPATKTLVAVGPPNEGGPITGLIDTALLAGSVLHIYQDEIFTPHSVENLFFKVPPFSRKIMVHASNSNAPYVPTSFTVRFMSLANGAPLEAMGSYSFTPAAPMLEPLLIPDSISKIEIENDELGDSIFVSPQFLLDL